MNHNQWVKTIRSIMNKKIAQWPHWVDEFIYDMARYLSQLDFKTKPQSFYCIFDGQELIESGMGFLFCAECNTYFLPTIDEAGNQSLKGIKK